MTFIVYLNYSLCKGTRQKKSVENYTLGGGEFGPGHFPHFKKNQLEKLEAAKAA